MYVFYYNYNFFNHKKIKRKIRSHAEFSKISRPGACSIIGPKVKANSTCQSYFGGPVSRDLWLSRGTSWRRGFSLCHFSVWTSFSQTLPQSWNTQVYSPISKCGISGYTKLKSRTVQKIWYEKMSPWNYLERWSSLTENKVPTPLLICNRQTPILLEN